MSVSRSQGLGRSLESTKRRVDQIWGRVVEVLADHEYVIEVTDIDSDNEDDYDEHEQVISERGSAELDDPVQVWVRKRDSSGVLFGRVAVEGEEGEDAEDAEDEEFAEDVEEELEAEQFEPEANEEPEPEAEMEEWVEEPDLDEDD